MCIQVLAVPQSIGAINAKDENTLMKKNESANTLSGYMFGDQLNVVLTGSL